MDETTTLLPQPPDINFNLDEMPPDTEVSVNFDEKKPEGAKELPSSDIDKRPWLMDALLLVGHTMASLTHIQEKKQYLLAEMNEAPNEEVASAKVDEIANLEDLHREVYQTYNEVMTHIMNLPEAKKEYRCLLKHTATSMVIAMELQDATTSNAIEEAARRAFNSFAGAVSLALGIEFKTCIRCIYDGLKSTSEEFSQQP